MKKIELVFVVILLSFSSTAQTTITLDSCYLLARHNFPLIKEQELISMTSQYTLENISKGFLPQININGQASYQSDITQLPKGIPGVPVLTKDQYKIYAEINQPVFDGGIIRTKKKEAAVDQQINQQQLEVELYQLKDRINQLFFGILLVDGAIKQNALITADIQLGLDKVNARLDNGVALRSNADVLKAELLKVNQKLTELTSNRKALTEMLSLFIGKPLDENTVFIKPQEKSLTAEMKRPELTLFDLQHQKLAVQENLITARNRPKLNFFLQGGFGKPAFNILANDFDPFYIGGLKLIFPLSGFYSQRNDRALIALGNKNIDVQKEVFLFNAHIALLQQKAVINKFRRFLKTDDEIISLRENVKKASLAQLQNGVINSGDYLREVNAGDEAELNRNLHEIQLLQAEYNQRNITGE